jgi:hypothetical protein
MEGYQPGSRQEERDLGLDNVGRCCSMREEGLVSMAGTGARKQEAPRAKSRQKQGRNRSPSSAAITNRTLETKVQECRHHMAIRTLPQRQNVRKQNLSFRLMGTMSSLQTTETRLGEALVGVAQQLSSSAAPPGEMLEMLEVSIQDDRLGKRTRACPKSIRQQERLRASQENRVVVVVVVGVVVGRW